MFLSRSVIFAGVSAVAILLSGISVSAVPLGDPTSFSNLIVFGDSLVDVGNRNDLASGAATPAAGGYFDGRFADGINFADTVNGAIEGSNSLASGQGGDNYGYGGARAIDNGDAVLDLGAQVGSYLSDAGGAADANALYLINIGGNDVRDILVAADPVAEANAVIPAAATEIVTQVLTLQAAGAQSILFVGVGDVGGIPETAAAGPAAQAFASFIAGEMNAAIAGSLPGTVQFFDTIAFFAALLADPTAFGLPAGIDVTTSCQDANPAGFPALGSCGDFAFLDSVHVTSAVSQALGGAIVAAIPEPGTGMLVALGLTALAVRRRAV